VLPLKLAPRTFAGSMAVYFATLDLSKTLPGMGLTGLKLLSDGLH
jgi:hypothetical protein